MQHIYTKLCVGGQYAYYVIITCVGGQYVYSHEMCVGVQLYATYMK